MLGPSSVIGSVFSLSVSTAPQASFEISACHLCTQASRVDARAWKSYLPIFVIDFFFYPKFRLTSAIALDTIKKHTSPSATVRRRHMQLILVIAADMFITQPTDLGCVAAESLDDMRHLIFSCTRDVTVVSLTFTSLKVIYIGMKTLSGGK